MTIQRMIELLKIEQECMLRKSRGICENNCGVCDLVQDDGELHEMYTNVIGIVKSMELVEPVKPKATNSHIGSPIWQCGKCGSWIGNEMVSYCWHCGGKVKW